MNDAPTLPVNLLAGRGHNSEGASLRDVLADELAEPRARADELLGAAKQACIADSTDAGAVADLIALIRDLERELDAARTKRKQPYLDQCRIVDTAYGAVIGPLARARSGPDSLQEMLDAWRAEHPDEQIMPSVAALGDRRHIDFVIEDIPAVLQWLLENKAAPLAQAIRTIVGHELKTRGVDAAAHAVIPGVSVTIEKRAQVR